MGGDDRTGRRAEVTAARVLEALIFAPIGAGARLVAEAPERWQQARSDLRAARFLGEMAVTRGAARLRERDAAPPAPRRPPRRAATEPVDAPDDRSADTAPHADGERQGASARRDVPSAEQLAIVDYDSVPAIDVVEQLPDLDADERARIGEYERAHRKRRTILGKIEQLEAAG